MTKLVEPRHMIPIEGGLHDLAFLDEERIAIIDRRRGLRLLDVRTGTIGDSLTMPVRTFQVPRFVPAPAGVLATHVGVVDATNQSIYGVPAGDDSDVLAVSPDGALVARSEQGRLVVAHVHDGGEDVRVDLTPWMDRIDSAAFLPSGRLAVARTKKPFVIVEAATGQVQTQRGTTLDGSPRALWPSPDGQWVADVPTDKKRIVVRSSVDGVAVADLKTRRSVTAAVWSPCSRWLLLAEGSAVSFIEVATWTITREIATAAQRAWGVAVSPSGALVATRSLGGWEPPHVFVWRLEDATEIGTKAAAAKPRAAENKGKKVTGVFFAADAAVELIALRHAAASLYHILDNQPDDFVMLVAPPETPGGRRWFTFLGSRGRTYYRFPWVACLWEDLGPLTVLCLDERTGVCQAMHMGDGQQKTVLPDDAARDLRTQVKTMRDAAQVVPVVLGRGRCSPDQDVPTIAPDALARLVPRVGVTASDWSSDGRYASSK